MSGPAKRRQTPRPRQQTPKEVLDGLLELVQRKFYQGEGVQFCKDRRLVLQWVLLWPAREFFNPKGVAVPADRYREILSGILIEAAAHQTGPIRYRPAWLAQVVQSHFRIHGEEIYEEAKGIRTLAEHALLTLGKLPPKQEAEIVPSFVAASRLLDRPKPVHKSPGKEQLSLL